jgi:hypothetical protein
LLAALIAFRPAAWPPKPDQDANQPESLAAAPDGT